MAMDNRNGRIIDGLASLMNAPSKIEIFEVHKESLIKTANLLQSLSPDQHEASRQIWDRQDSVRIDVAYFKCSETVAKDALEVGRKQTRAIISNGVGSFLHRFCGDPSG